MKTLCGEVETVHTLFFRDPNNSGMTHSETHLPKRLKRGSRGASFDSGLSPGPIVYTKQGLGPESDDKK